MNPTPWVGARVTLERRVSLGREEGRWDAVAGTVVRGGRVRLDDPSEEGAFDEGVYEVALDATYRADEAGFTAAYCVNPESAYRNEVRLPVVRNLELDLSDPDTLAAFDRRLMLRLFEAKCRHISTSTKVEDLDWYSIYTTGFDGDSQDIIFAAGGHTDSPRLHVTLIVPRAEPLPGDLILARILLWQSVQPSPSETAATPVSPEEP